MSTITSTKQNNRSFRETYDSWLLEVRCKEKEPSRNKIYVKPIPILNGFQGIKKWKILTTI
jgi:hypothetical protein